MDNWFAQIESTVLTYLQYMLCEKTGALYPNLNCTTKSQSAKPSDFPTLYLHSLTPIERDQDLENDTINSVLATLEIQVFSNQSETEAKKIMTDVVLLMKSLRWGITMLPDPQTNDKISYCIARFRKLVMESDIEE